MSKVIRRMDTPEARQFWESLEDRVYADHQRENPGCNCADACKGARARREAKEPGRWKLLEIDE